MLPKAWPTTRLPGALDTRREVVSLWRKRFFADRLAGLEEHLSSGSPPDFFPPDLVVQVKALACELPSHMTCRCPAGA